MKSILLDIVFLTVCGSYILVWVHGIAIDNGVLGDPDITCGSSDLSIKFRTQHAFGGHIYVKGRFSEAPCRIDGDQAPNNEANIVVSFDTCGVKRARSVNPKGILMTVTVLIMFHSRFQTKVDRAYYVQCFYMEAEKTVTAELDVSMLTTTSLLAQAPMPTCRYQVLDGKGGQTIRYAKVGDPVHHRWTCDATVANTYCMVVHTCLVDDGSGNTVTLIDSNGCAQDQYLLGNLEYFDDLAVGRDAHVFKYADKSTVSFNCQISVAPKQQGICPRPSCPQLDDQPPLPAPPPAGTTPYYPPPTTEFTQLAYTSTLLPAPPAWIDRKIRLKRFAADFPQPRSDFASDAVDDDGRNGTSAIVDVDTQPILVFDMDSRLDISKLNRVLTEKEASGASNGGSWRTLCVPKPLFSIYAVTSVLMVIVSFAILSAISCNRCRRQSIKRLGGGVGTNLVLGEPRDDIGNKLAHSRYSRFFALRLTR